MTEDRNRRDRREKCTASLDCAYTRWLRFGNSSQRVVFEALTVPAQSVGHSSRVIPIQRGCWSGHSAGKPSFIQRSYWPDGVER